MSALGMFIQFCFVSLSFDGVSSLHSKTVFHEVTYIDLVTVSILADMIGVHAVDALGPWGSGLCLCWLCVLSLFGSIGFMHCDRHGYM